MKATIALVLLLLVSTVCIAQEETQEPQATIGIYIVTNGDMLRMLSVRNDGIDLAATGLATFSHAFVNVKGGATYQGATSMYNFTIS